MRIRLASLLALLFALQASPSHAQNVVLEARQRLQTYDLAGTGTTDVLRSLGAFIDGPGGEPEKREARFLRALTAADLLILAMVKHDEALVARVASAFGVPLTQLVPVIDGELRQLTTGFYAEAAAESRELLRELGRWQRSSLAHLTGLRRDYLYLTLLLEELEHAENPSQTLGELGTDPCASPCTGVLSALDPRSRKVFGAVSEMRRMLRDLVRARRQNDPFAKALDPLEPLGARLTALPITLAYVIPETVSIAQTNSPVAATNASPNAVAFISATEIKVSNLPTITVEPDGSAGLDSRDPTYPGGTTIRLPPSYPEEIRSIDALVGPLRDRFSGRRVALAPVPAVSAEIVARVALTLRAAGAEIVAVAGRTELGATAFFPVSYASSRPNVPLVVHVTGTGYTVELGPSRAQIARIREGSGARYDVAGLGQRLGTTQPDRAALVFTRTVGFGAVVSAISRIRARPVLVLHVPEPD